mmetsp:Transcript_19104/g.38964  ORF Transcript_19104/g.38964 Transcript_19104/m.38964 type:complete len:90 (+) Transcript_19104:440-709(+)
MNTRGIKKNSQVRILLEDQRVIEGQLVACDFHMNTLVKNSMEFKKTQKTHKWQKRILGLCIIRGDSITSISLEAGETSRHRKKPPSPEA